MFSKTVMFGVFALLAVSAAAVAEQPNAELQALDDALPGTLINDPTRLDRDVFGTGQTSKSVKGDDIPSSKAALQISVPKAGATLYEVGANAPITAGIKSGTDVMVAFYVRTMSAGTSAGKGVLALHFGAAAQAIEVGQVFVINRSQPAPGSAQ